MIVLGFDPGGQGKFGCAAIDTVRNSVTACRSESVDQAIDWALKATDGFEVYAAGIDTLLCWQSTAAGWRGADEYLKSRYPKCSNSVASANSLYGAMSVQGAVLAYRLREIWPGLFLTETHPKVLWHCLQKGTEYPRQKTWETGASSTVRDWLSDKGFIGEIHNEDEFDAVISAWAASQAYSANWKRDLFQINAANQTSGNISVVPDVHYFWPE